MLWYPTEAVKVDVNTPRREVTAYAAIFGNVDLQDGRCVRGCFAKTLEERLAEGQIKLFRDHWQHIGVVRHAVEDERGLLTVSYVSKTSAGDDALEQMADGSLSRFSFRGRIMRATTSVEQPPGGGEPREILDLREICLKEVGPVDLDPANPEAKILAVKSLDNEALDALSELPDLLKSLKLGRRMSPDETRVVKSLVRLREQLNERGDFLEALLQAPGTVTRPPVEEAAPTSPTRAAVEKADSAGMEELVQLLRRRGQLQP